MRFHWDNGNLKHIARHEVTRQEAEQVIENDPLDTGVVIRNGETRTVHLGETHAGRILMSLLPSAMECTESLLRDTPTPRKTLST